LSADKRSVSTDALETLGTFLQEGEKRDAIHLAVEPVIAGEKLRPGQHLVLRGGKAYACDKHSGAIGIVDPFLPWDASPGDRFWLVVLPRKITSLRHVWTHPDFPVEQDLELGMSESERYIHDLAEQVGFSYKRLMEGARAALEYDDYLVGGNDMQGVSTPPEFWDHYEKVTKEKVPPNKRNNFFSCSC
jgi:hypothetical protein